MANNINRANALMRQLQPCPSSSLTSSPLSSFPSLSSHVAALGLSNGLVSTIHAIATATTEISHILASSITAKASSSPSSSSSSSPQSNVFGDVQLNVDLLTDRCVLDNLRRAGTVKYASSEENPTLIDLFAPAVPSSTGHSATHLTSPSSSTASFSSPSTPITPMSDVYCVAYDPLDGSSVIDANFSVGSIFAIFPGAAPFAGRRRSALKAAVLSTYGPRTTIVVAVKPHAPFEATLDPNTKQWRVTRSRLTIAPSTRTFACANLRAVRDNEPYKGLVEYYMKEGYTLRYSGALVADVAHILVKGHGIFLSPLSGRARAKLRVLYECLAVALVVELSGGLAVDERGLAMLGEERVMESMVEKSGLIVGSREEVQRYVERGLDKAQTAKAKAAN